MGGPMRPMHQATMAPPQQPQHPHSHRNNPHAGHQILSMPTHQPQPHMAHHMQHPGLSHGNQRHIMGQNGLFNAFYQFTLFISYF